MIFNHWATTAHLLVLALLVLQTAKNAMEYFALPAMQVIIFFTELACQVVNKYFHNKTFVPFC